MEKLVYDTVLKEYIRYPRRKSGPVQMVRFGSLRELLNKIVEEEGDKAAAAIFAYALINLSGMQKYTTWLDEAAEVTPETWARISDNLHRYSIGAEKLSNKEPLSVAEVQKKNMEWRESFRQRQKLQTRVGEKAKGILFQSIPYRCKWAPSMVNYIGVEGVIERFDTDKGRFMIRFPDSTFKWYPAELIMFQFEE